MIIRCGFLMGHRSKGGRSLYTAASADFSYPPKYYETLTVLFLLIGIAIEVPGGVRELYGRGCTLRGDI